MLPIYSHYSSFSCSTANSSTGAVSKKPFVPGHRKYRSDGASIFLSCSGGGGVASTSEDSLQPWSNSGTLSNAGSDERFRHLGRNSMPCVLKMYICSFFMLYEIPFKMRILAKSYQVSSFSYRPFTTAWNSNLSSTTPCSKIPTKRCLSLRRRRRAARPRTPAASANSRRRRG